VRKAARWSRFFRYGTPIDFYDATRARELEPRTRANSRYDGVRYLNMRGCHQRLRPPQLIIPNGAADAASCDAGGESGPRSRVRRPRACEIVARVTHQLRGPLSCHVCYFSPRRRSRFFFRKILRPRLKPGSYADARKGKGFDLERVLKRFICFRLP